MPYTWILECLNLFKFPTILINCLKYLLAMWHTALFLQLPHSDHVELCTVSVKCGIFQGDTLSPLLFCLAINPLSYLLDHLGGYYNKVSYDLCLTHLLYMNDLKLFAPNDAGLSQLLATVHKFSSDICMDFGLLNVPN